MTRVSHDKVALWGTSWARVEGEALGGTEPGELGGGTCGPPPRFLEDAAGPVLPHPSYPLEDGREG